MSKEITVLERMQELSAKTYKKKLSELNNNDEVLEEILRDIERNAKAGLYELNVNTYKYFNPWKDNYNERDSYVFMPHEIFSNDRITQVVRKRLSEYGFKITKSDDARFMISWRPDPVKGTTITYGGGV